MKKNQNRAALLALCLGISLSLAACQPAPENEVVVGKNQIQDLISNTEANGSIPDGTPSTAVPSESTFQKTYTPSENLQFIIDAKVETYDSAMPVLLVKPHEFTVEEVRPIADYFFQGQTAYESRYVMTKEEIQKRILEIKAWMNDTNGLLACANSPEHEQDLRAQYEQEIQFWEERYETAVDDYQPKECDWQFHPASYFDETLEMPGAGGICENDKASYIKASATVNGKALEVEAMNHTTEGYIGHHISFGLSWEDPIWNTGGTSGTEEEAKQLADQLLHDLGIQDRWNFQQCMKSEFTQEDGTPTGGYSFYISYLPIFEGFSLSDLQDISQGDGDHYAPFYSYESLDVTIANGEIIQFNWSSPLEVVSVENAAVTELSFDQIMERFAAQMEISYPFSWFQLPGKEGDPESTGPKVEEAAFKITGIKRRLSRVLVPNATMEYYLIPTWSFYGFDGVRAEGDSELTYDFIIVDENGNKSTEPKPASHVLSLSALDGSVIQAGLGY
ncbi:DUF6034 family protein [Hominifimenecus sp. rT4P-3]|uniref:DUF6034 family protein n=1 Tax=Hominifimenecus sp. rT4P-3 TaxID=3242979 RepID=UPI003DA4EC2C